MEQQKDKYADCLEHAKALVVELEAKRYAEADTLLSSLSRLHENGLFQEIGKLTRELHDTLNSFESEPNISKLTALEIPDAKERLNHVITLTQNAANKTLSVVEDTLPRSEQLKKNAISLKAEWDRFTNRDMQVEEFRGLSNEIDEFLQWTAINAVEIHKGLSDVMMAQDFQDLTGQIIKRVITLVQEVEDSLVGLIRITGKNNLEKPSGEVQNPGKNIEATGPQVPGLKRESEVVSGQDEVDDLLSSLGF